MDTFHLLMNGFAVAFKPLYIFYCLIGVLGGTLVGVLPAIGPVQAVAILLPMTLTLDPIGAIIMLSAVHYGAMYGGSTTSILVNVPGEAASVVTCFDGYPMALKGRAGPALGISAMGSFIAGTFGIIGLMFFAPVLGRAALRFSAPEYFSLMMMSLILVTYMSRGSMLKALTMLGFGLIFSTVGLDAISSSPRFTYHTLYLQDGLHIIPLVLGLFGLREVFHNFQAPPSGEILRTKIKGLLPSLQDWKDSAIPIVRCSFLGFFMGILPGVSPTAATFISYGMEKKLSKHPEKFGTGVIEAVAGPESCNNATVFGHQIPLWSLGLPTGTMSTMILAALIIWGYTPGPQFIKNSPDLFWGLIASMYLGNAMLLVLNLPLIPIWIKLLKTPPILLNFIILVFCVIGAYAVNQQIEDLYMLLIFGLMGFIAKQLKYEGGPLILGFILGPRIEISLRQSLILYQGSFRFFWTRPMTALFTAVTFFFLFLALSDAKKKMKKMTESVEEY